MVDEIKITEAEIEKIEKLDFQYLSDMIADIKREYSTLNTKLEKEKKRMDAMISEIKIPSRETVIKLKYLGNEYNCYINTNGLIIEELPHWDWATVREKLLYIKIFKAYIYALWKKLCHLEEELKKIEIK
jgi:hypothetical protein